jgi:hypothetical protein
LIARMTRALSILFISYLIVFLAGYAVRAYISYRRRLAFGERRRYDNRDYD